MSINLILTSVEKSLKDFESVNEEYENLNSKISKLVEQNNKVYSDFIRIQRYLQQLNVEKVDQFTQIESKELCHVAVECNIENKGIFDNLDDKIELNDSEKVSEEIYSKTNEIEETTIVDEVNNSNDVDILTHTKVPIKEKSSTKEEIINSESYSKEDIMYYLEKYKYDFLVFIKKNGSPNTSSYEKMFRSLSKEDKPSETKLRKRRRTKSPVAVIKPREHNDEEMNDLYGDLDSVQKDNFEPMPIPNDKYETVTEDELKIGQDRILKLTEASKMNLILSKREKKPKNLNVSYDTQINNSNKPESQVKVSSEIKCHEDIMETDHKIQDMKPPKEPSPVKMTKPSPIQTKVSYDLSEEPFIVSGSSMRNLSQVESIVKSTSEKSKSKKYRKTKPDLEDGEIV